MTWNPIGIRAHAATYDRQVFLRAMEQAVHTQWMSYKQHHATRI
jgi:hypothetical protein